MRFTRIKESNVLLLFTGYSILLKVSSLPAARRLACSMPHRHLPEVAHALWPLLEESIRWSSGWRCVSPSLPIRWPVEESVGQGYNAQLLGSGEGEGRGGLRLCRASASGSLQRRLSARRFHSGLASIEKRPNLLAC